MANPAIATRPIVLIEPEDGRFRVSIWHAPTGVWRHTGEDDLVSDLERARDRAGALAFATGAYVAIDPVQQ